MLERLVGIKARAQGCPGTHRACNGAAMTQTSSGGSVVSAEELQAFFESMQSGKRTMRQHVVSVGEGTCVMRFDCGPGHLRPGGFISGPTQMGLADSVAYAVVFTRAGITPMALTSNLNINFLRPCQGETLEARAKLLKFGKAGVVVDVELRGSSSDKLSSHAIVTYVVPPKDD